MGVGVAEIKRVIIVYRVTVAKEAGTLSFNWRVASLNPCSTHFGGCVVEQDTSSALPAVGARGSGGAGEWQPPFFQPTPGPSRMP